MRVTYRSIEVEDEENVKIDSNTWVEVRKKL